MYDLLMFNGLSQFQDLLSTNTATIISLRKILKAL
jgi:hypothetical protein